MSFSYFSSVSSDADQAPVHNTVHPVDALSQISKLCVGAKHGIYSSDWIELMKLRTILAEIQDHADKALTDNASALESK